MKNGQPVAECKPCLLSPYPSRAVYYVFSFLQLHFLWLGEKK